MTDVQYKRTMKPTFFATRDEFREWLAKNHESEPELLVGFRKKSSGRQSITWPESVEEALCFGWIDGIRRAVDDESYCIRFTPRRRGSTWSKVNIEKAQELIQTGRMREAGLRAFEERDSQKSGTYLFEQRNSARLPPEDEVEFRANPAAWEFWQAQPPGYRKTVTWWVVSAKQEATRKRRLQTLVEDSAEGRRIGLLSRQKKSP